MRAWWRRAPKWQRIAVAVVAGFLGLSVLAGLFGERPPPPTAQPLISQPTTTTSAAPPPITVLAVVDNRTVTLSNGEKLVMDDLAPAGPCWARSAVSHAVKTLKGQEVTVVAGSLVLPSGDDYAVMALSAGMGRTSTGAASVLTTAEQSAKTAGLGLWGAPCLGQDEEPAKTVAPPAPTTTEQAPPPVQQAPPTTHQAPPPVQRAVPPVQTTEQKRAVSYGNCAEARAAGAAPLHRGEPGYSSKLDRDGDGVACE